MNQILPYESIELEIDVIALMIALHCVRNTIIEDYHAEGKLSDSEMGKFNREVANKIYTFLVYANHKDTKEKFLKLYALPKDFDWDLPMLDTNFLKAMSLPAGN